MEGRKNEDKKKRKKGRKKERKRERKEGRKRKKEKGMSLIKVLIGHYIPFRLLS
jgi:hypothetical protein